MFVRACFGWLLGPRLVFRAWGVWGLVGLSGGGAVSGWWSRARGLVRSCAGALGVWGLVGLCGVFFVVLVSVFVLVG